MYPANLREKWGTFVKKVFVGGGNASSRDISNEGTVTKFVENVSPMPTTTYAKFKDSI